MTNTELLNEFCDSLWLEDGLSRNTLESYRRDLRKFSEWMEKQRHASLLQATYADIQGFLAHLVSEQKAKATSTSRTISSLKRLFDSWVAIAEDGTIVFGCDDGHLRAYRPPAM